jgi:ParB family chromosome partitioning protein
MKHGLGRGLSALMEEVAGTAPASAPPRNIPIASIDPRSGQPRKRFDEDAMAELVASVRDAGILQPILLRRNRPDNGRFEIVAGERRWRAAQAAGLHEIPALVRDLQDNQAATFAIVENVQRADLNPIEEADAYARLHYDFSFSHENISDAVGKSRSHVTNMIRLRDLPEPVLDAVRGGKLAMGHARALLGHPEAEALAAKAVAGGWSVRQVEAAVKSAKAPPRDAPERKAPERDANVAALENQLGDALGVKVRISGGAPGEVTIHFTDLDQLDLICARLGGEGRF